VWAEDYIADKGLLDAQDDTTFLPNYAAQYDCPPRSPHTPVPTGCLRANDQVSSLSLPPPVCPPGPVQGRGGVHCGQQRAPERRGAAGPAGRHHFPPYNLHHHYSTSRVSLIPSMHTPMPSTPLTRFTEFTPLPAPPPHNLLQALCKAGEESIAAHRDHLKDEGLLIEEDHPTKAREGEAAPRRRQEPATADALRGNSFYCHSCQRYHEHEEPMYGEPPIPTPQPGGSGGGGVSSEGVHAYSRMLTRIRPHGEPLVGLV
jgi:hypothetical protein